MEGMQLNIWAVLVIVGAAQGFFLSFVFLQKRNQSHRFFALLLLVVSLHLIEYSLAISGLSLRWPHLVASTYPLIFTMGPLYYLYVRSMLEPVKFDLRGSLHFLPALLVLLFFLPFYLQSADQKLDFILSLESNGTIDVPVEQLVFMWSHVIQTLIYVLIARKWMIMVQTKIRTQTSGSEHLKFKWLRSFNTAFAIYLILYFLSIFIVLASSSYRVEVDYLVVLLMAVMIYAIAYATLRQPAILEVRNNVERRSMTVSEERSGEISKMLSRHLREDKPYLKEDLKLADVAESIGIAPYQISEVISTQMKTNFYDLVNSYRVEEAQRLLIDPANDDLKILAVAFDSGFGNKATFNRAFKKHTGRTPSQVREQRQ